MMPGSQSNSGRLDVGTASIFVNDDGIKAGLSDVEVEARKEFYHNNNIGWVARPRDKSDGFVRKGKFKKASNMNFALNASDKVESYLIQMVADKCAGSPDMMVDDEEEEELYERALHRVLEENPLIQAEGNIRVGDIILIVDSDTRVVSVMRAEAWACLAY